jgi:V8-like Glu-specific endopeptidase
MKSFNRSFLSLVLMAAIAFSAAPFTFAFDEGMFTPDQIAKLPLKARGLKIRPIDIYNPAGGGLTEAVIRLSIGCTAEFISPEGLILTNHHCGFGALVSASTPDKDLVETGFNAGSRAGEYPAKDYSIFIAERVDDVTSKIKAGTENLTGDALTAAITKNTQALTAAEQAKAPAGSRIRIQGLDSGYFYYLYQTHEIKDIRVVYAPPRSIGIFGGDPDNFEWTRHTGDFSILRAYTAPDGTAAAYSANNVPYKSKKFLTINAGGLKDNDFVFVLGYPGGTTRYRESWSIQYARDANFPFLYKWLRAFSDSLKAIGLTDEAKRIAFQDEIANFDNSRKLFEGGTHRLRLASLVQARQEDEARMATWIAANPDRQRKYGTVLSELKTLSEETNAASKRDVITRRFPDPNSMPVFIQIVTAATAVKGGQTLTAEQKSQRLTQITEAFKTREPYLEREMLKFFFKQMDELPADQRFAAADQKFGNKKGKDRRDAEAAFASQIADGDLSKPESIMALYNMSWGDLQAKHPFVAGLVDERAALQARTAKFNAGIDHLRVLYMEALTQSKGITPYPDANLTMRFTYGNVKGYQSREAEFRTPFTTLKGMIEKDTGEVPFDVPQKLKDLQAAHDFGRWGSNDSVGLNFTATTDIIGGNSGSPVFNGNGEQVGLVFDGNFEGLGNDFYFDPAVNRTISVDIRFLLFTLEKFSGAGYLLNEMKIVGVPKGRAGGAVAANQKKLVRQDDRLKPFAYMP